VTENLTQTPDWPGPVLNDLEWELFFDAPDDYWGIYEMADLPKRWQPSASDAEGRRMLVQAFRRLLELGLIYFCRAGETMFAPNAVERRVSSEEAYRALADDRSWEPPPSADWHEDQRLCYTATTRGVELYYKTAENLAGEQSDHA